jgi:hypothetical protein
MIDKLLFEYKQKKKSNHTIKIKSHSLSRKTKKDDKNLSEAKTEHKPLNKNLYKRNILFNSKQNNIHLKSTSTSSLSSSAEKKYLTPTKFNMQNYDNDYYFNESYNKTQELFNNANISRPTLDFNSGHKKRNKNILLTIGTRLNTVNNSNTYNNNVGKSKDLLINRSFKVSKNKYVICRKNNFSNNNSRIKDNLKDIESKSMENNRKNNESQENLCKCLNIKDDYNHNVNSNNTSIKEKCFLNDISNENDNKTNNLKIFNKERKYKNIVLRPYKIQKENQLKHNIKVNKHEVDDSPKIINKIMTRLNIKPKYSRVFKYK